MRGIITKIQKECPELTFNNKGYECLPQSVQEKYKAEIKQIEDILKQVIEGFIKFNNFKITHNGVIHIRCQYYWSSNFAGVGYFALPVVEQHCV